MTLHPETTKTTSADGASQTDESTAWTDPEPAAEPNAADLKSADLPPTAPDPQATAGAGPAAQPSSPDPQSVADAGPAARPTSPDPAADVRSAGGGVKADVGPAPMDSREEESGQEAAVATDGDPLLSAGARQELGSRWTEIQANFVDHPQGSVQEADALVVEVMQRVTGSLSNERERLESQWRQGDDVSTEDLRVALTRYRSFFDRLLSA